MMESEMQCPHCKIGLRIEGDQLVCSCGYRRDSPYKKVLSQDELLKENAKLKLLLNEVAQFLRDFSEYGNSEKDFMRSGKRYLRDIEDATKTRK